MARGRQTGRIQVCDRTVDDTTDIIGADIEIDEGHANDIVETTQSSMERKGKREYRNRISHVYKFLQEAEEARDKSSNV